jgi:RNA polymerase sigma factor (sigma-70 family)
MINNSSLNSVTELIRRLKLGDSYAAYAIWKRYVNKLTFFAKMKLQSCRRKIEDEHDAVQLAYVKFLESVSSAKFDSLEDRHDLWQILTMLTERRVYDIMRRENTLKRGNQHFVCSSDLVLNESEQGNEFSVFRDEKTDSYFFTEFWDEFEECLRQLNDPILVQITLKKFNGKTNEAISSELGISVSTIKRKIKRVEEIWQGRNG